MRPTIAAAVLAALALAGCSTASAAAHPSQLKPVPAALTAAQDNAQVCRNYLKQRAWVKGLVQPTIADATQFEGDVLVDWGNTYIGSRLYKDLDAMHTDMADFNSAAEYAASTRVYDDCT